MRRVPTCALACVFLGVTCPYLDSTTKCVVVANDNVFGQVISSAEVTSPDRCPFYISSGRTATQRFEGVLDGMAPNITTSSPVTVGVYIGNTSLRARTPLYYNFVGSPLRSQPSIDYVAGQGSNIYSTTGKDVATLDIGLAYGGVTRGSSDLTFDYRARVSVTTVSNVPPGSVPISSAVANVKLPVTYQWYQNNVLLPYAGASFTKTLLDGSYVFKVIARDVEGDTGSVSKTISVADDPGGSNCGSVCPK